MKKIKIKIINKNEIPETPKVVKKKVLHSEDGEKINVVTIKSNKNIPPSKYNKGFAKLKITKYYHLFGEWFLEITK